MMFKVQFCTIEVHFIEVKYLHLKEKNIWQSRKNFLPLHPESALDCFDFHTAL